MSESKSVLDTRKPSPPFGYSRLCSHTLEQQIDIVALFHANRIKPNRIAYRVGIDIDLIENLIAGELQQKSFKYLVAKHRRERRNQRIDESKKIVGIRQAELQVQIEAEYRQLMHQQ